MYHHQGFEDCVVLNELMNQYGDDHLDRVLPAFTEYRHVDAHAICDLAMYNFIEMRDLVNQWSFLMRKRFDNVMHWLFPNWWVPLYTSVTFSRMRYHLCIENKKWQDRVYIFALSDKKSLFFNVRFPFLGGAEATVGHRSCGDCNYWCCRVQLPPPLSVLNQIWIKYITNL